LYIAGFYAGFASIARPSPGLANFRAWRSMLLREDKQLSIKSIFLRPTLVTILLPTRPNLPSRVG
jgi:hypothetical protein